GQQNNCRVQMYSVMSGALVLDQQVVNFNSNFNVNVSNVPNGLYFLILLQGNEIIQQQTILVCH
ncbi:MAG: T9SS type A sorting domain-containing protein, partial [Bacteroidales bacterium]|nr:T9SS type A sorting domain-containing protein [Bacteroidales bacterium]